MSILEVDFTSERVESRWYMNPYKLVDAEDLLTNKAGAYVFLLDLLVNRPTEFAVMIRMFMRALANIDLGAIQLTHRQEEAVLLAREAVANGIHPTAYVASKLNVTPRAVQRLFNRADTRVKMFAFGELFDVSNDTMSIEWTPSEDAIQAKMAALPRECAGHGTDGCSGVTRGAFALCWNCHNKYGHRRNDFEPLTAKWLLPEIRRIQSDHRQLAINELYREHNASEYERKSRKIRRAA